MSASDLEILATVPAQRILKAARAMGLVCRYDRSALSEAEYLRVSDGEDEVKIRLATHEARPTYQNLYGSADFEVGKWGKTGPGTHGDEWDAVEWLARRFRRKLPAFAEAERREARRAAALKAAATRERGRKERETTLVRELVKKLRAAGVAKPPTLSDLSRDHALSGESARRVKRALQKYLGVVSVDVEHNPVSMADRPPGTVRSIWKSDYVDRPWEATIAYRNGRSDVHRFATRDEAEDFAREYREGPSG